MTENAKWSGGDDWNIQEIQSVRKKVTRAKQRRGLSLDDSADIIDRLIDDSRISIVKEFLVSPPSRITRGSGNDSELVFDAEVAGSDSSVLAIRHPSGAISFHAPEAIAAIRRGGKSSNSVRFRVALRGSSLQGTRRGLIGKVVRAIVLKIAGKLTDLAMPSLVRAWEERAWKSAGRQEGWHLVTRDSLIAGKLQSAIPQPEKRSLLLLHGTFSNAATAYASLAQSDFFSRVGAKYDRRIYAFNHFSLSRTPAQNAQMLLEALDASQVYNFDVVTHSRGGLVLRTLVERQDVLGASAGRLKVGKAVLVASPNDGTPLATPDRWQHLLNWMANLLEMFPDNPWSEAASWITDGLVWIANRVAGGIPGIGAMDAGGETISGMQDDPGPPVGVYSALVANYRAEDGIVQRAIDVGADAVFSTANDLVVPTEGGWRTGKSSTDFIPGDRVGCFGVGGNLLPSLPGTVSHINFFDRPETIEFLVRALTDKPQQLPRIAVDRSLPNRRANNAVTASTRLSDNLDTQKGTSVSVETFAERASGEYTSITSRVPSNTSTGLEVFDGDTPPLHLVLLPEHETGEQRRERRGRQSLTEDSIEEHASAQMLATFGSARILEPFYLRGSAGPEWHNIISMQKRLQSYVDANPGSTLPSDQELIMFGTQLFETLFPGRVRRLYDEARARSNGRRLDIIFTSMIPWVADKPWEFAYDPMRRSFLTTEDVQFVRNVLTAVPAQHLQPHSGALRILVVVAQPIGQAKLSVDEEIVVIRRGFEPLIAAGMAEVEVLTRATPNTLHGRLSTEHFDVVHFIGHGEFDVEREQGLLLFEDDAGNVQKVNDNNLRSIFCQRGVRLLFLNACETARGGRADFNRGVAPAVVAGGMPVVVANQFKVLDVSATSFAQHFYWSLAAGLTVGDAARESRIAVNYSLAGEAIDWAVPVVYARDPNAKFCKHMARTGVILTGVTPASIRRSDLLQRVKIGVWDIQHEYPELEGLVEQWNEAQTAYEFIVVDPSVPIGGWQVHGSGNEKVTYLRSDKLQMKLQPTVRQLGVEVLICISGYPMTDGETLNIYASWGEGSIVVLSTWGLEVDQEMRPKLLTNLVAGGLIAQRAKMDTSPEKPRTSPFYYNEERDVSLLTATRKIDTQSKKEIREALGESASTEIEAIEKMFTLFRTSAR
jgi:hypothetical protein